MWSEIEAQRAALGDTNDCKARVDAVPNSGTVIGPGADVNAALANANVVVLSGGTYTLSRSINIPVGKKLVGAAGQTVVIDASNVSRAFNVGNNATLANVVVADAREEGVVAYNPGSGTSSGTLIYQVSVRRTGLKYTGGTGASGIFLTQGASYNCVVSSEVSDTWNELGAPNDHGGNADGVNNSNGAHHNTFIDVHSYRNGDDGIDMWDGGVAFFYFSRAFDNGKTSGKTLTGDGNGIKLGIGSVAHKFYRTTANTNKAQGYNLNGNTVQPVLVQSTASGNGTTDYGNGITPPR